MKDWRKYTAQEFCLNVTDGTHDSPKPTEVGHYLITSKHLQNNAIDFSSAYKISEGDYQKVIKRSAVVQHDILFSMIGTIGNIVRVKDPIIDYAVKNMAIFKMGSDELKSKWLYYWLKSSKAKEYISSRLAGSTQSYLTLETLRNFPVFAPSENEVQKIVSILSSIDDKIELNRQINDNLEEQAQALYKSWFVDFEPFKDSDFVESDLGLIPKGWSTGSIYKYVNVIYGAPYKSTLFNENKEGYPLIRIRDLKTFSPQFYTTEVLPQTEYIKSGDVVAGMDAEFIPCLWQGETGVLNQRCCKFVGKDKEINNLFVLHLVKPELEYVQSYKTGTTVSHLGKADIDRFIVILPDEAIVHQFSKICRPLLDEQNKCAVEIRRLTNLRDALLPKLMSGELKINDLDC